MPILELCAGYGGLGIAVEALIGDKVTVVAEVHGAACKVMSYRFPDAPNIGDIRYQTWTPLVGEIDTITAGFPARTSQTPGSARGSRVTVQASGTTSPKQFGSFDPDTRSWRTSAHSVIGDKTKSSHRFTRSGMTRRGRLFELARSAPRITGTDGFASPHLPSPTVSDGYRGPDFAKRDRDGSGGDDLVTAVARLFPGRRQSNCSRRRRPTWHATGALSTRTSARLAGTARRWRTRFVSSWTSTRTRIRSTVRTLRRSGGGRSRRPFTAGKY